MELKQKDLTMTVKEVMEKLKTCNPKAQVHFRNTFTYWYIGKHQDGKCIQFNRVDDDVI